MSSDDKSGDGKGDGKASAVSKVKQTAIKSVASRSRGPRHPQQAMPPYHSPPLPERKKDSKRRSADKLVVMEGKHFLVRRRKLVSHETDEDEPDEEDGSDGDSVVSDGDCGGGMGHGNDGRGGGGSGAGGPGAGMGIAAN